MSVQAPVFFLARERNLAEEAWPGDIIGIPNRGSLRIGDTLTEGEAIRVTGIPNFAPEILQRVKVEDPMKSRRLSGYAQVIRGTQPKFELLPAHSIERRRFSSLAAKRIRAT